MRERSPGLRPRHCLVPARPGQGAVGKRAEVSSTNGRVGSIFRKSSALTSSIVAVGLDQNAMAETIAVRVADDYDNQAMAKAVVRP